MSEQHVTVVGAGLAGLACARALHDAGASVRVLDRGRVPGGRLASRRLDDRPVDLGASYLTAEPGSRFAAVVDDWVARGLARPWTDTFRVADDERACRALGGRRVPRAKRVSAWSKDPPFRFILRPDRQSTLDCGSSTR